MTLVEGDQVTLKSGSPPFTVVETNGGTVRCMWWNATTGQVNNEWFRESVLVKAVT